MKNTLCILLTFFAAVFARAQESGSGYVARLRPHDTVSFRVLEDPEQKGPQQLVVSAAGKLRFPVSQGSTESLNLDAANKTIEEIKAEVKEALDKDFYKNATVDLEPVQLQGPENAKVIFLGEVKRPNYEFDPTKPKSLFEAVVEIGYSEFANLKKVKIDRVDPKTGERKEIIVNLEDVKKGKRDRDVFLQDQDRVTVPEKKIMFQ